MYTYVFKDGTSFSNKNAAREYLMETLKKDEKWIEKTLQDYISLQEIYAMLNRCVSGCDIRNRLEKYVFASATKFAREHFNEYFIESDD